LPTSRKNKYRWTEEQPDEPVAQSACVMCAGFPRSKARIAP
jgi:hypothetical protein